MTSGVQPSNPKWKFGIQASYLSTFAWQSLLYHFICFLFDFNSNKKLLVQYKGEMNFKYFTREKLINLFANTNK
jgi:hypothetical protein